MSQIPKGPGGGGGSRLAQMQAQFQQKQMQEKEAKLLQMLDSQQQKAMQKAGLNGVLPASNRYSNSNLLNNNNHNNLAMNGNNAVSNVGAGKVRQMFEERRRNGGTLSSNSNSNGYGSRNGALTGIDKGHPLEPLVVANTSSKSRSSSSKSDPANYGTGTNGVRNTQAPPIMKPANLGSTNRATSLNRERSVSRESQAPTTHTTNNSFNNHNNKSTLSSANSNASSTGGKPYHQRQQQKSNASHPPPPPPVTQNSAPPPEDFFTPHTTKYSDYAQELEKRENALASKLRKTHISSPDDNASNGGGSSSPTHKSSPSPTQRSGNSSPSRPNSKSPTTMSTPGARATAAAGRPSVSKPASYLKKTGGSSKIIKSKPSAPPRSSAGPPPGLDECKVCGRYFAPERIQKHEVICKKTSTKKRKVFDPTKMRMQGTEAEPYIRVVSAKPAKAPAAPTVSAKKADWRKKHEEFIATIRAAKEYQAHVAKGGDPKDLPPPPPSDNSDYIQCPYCNRKFSEGAAERHIPKCKNIKSNKR